VKTIEIATQALQNDLQRLAHISQNLANVQTPGYKRMVSVQRPFAAEMDAAASESELAVPVDATPDISAGALRATGNALDVAIDGDGFLAIQSPQGPALTRQASLRLDAQGRVVNAAGLPVLGERGELRVSTAASTLRVDSHGELWADDHSAGRLRVLSVADPASLRPLGGGLYGSGDANPSQPVESPRFKVGYQETSNVNSSAEMVRLMETGRHFEAMVRVVQGYDEAVEKAIRKLGEL
jgi:flagellar basal body rod protein FlgG